MSRQARDNLLSSLPKFKTELLTSYREIGFGAATVFTSISFFYTGFRNGMGNVN